MPGSPDYQDPDCRELKSIAENNPALGKCRANISKGLSESTFASKHGPEFRRDQRLPRFSRNDVTTLFVRSDTSSDDLDASTILISGRSSRMYV